MKLQLGFYCANKYILESNYIALEWLILTGYVQNVQKNSNCD